MVGDQEHFDQATLQAAELLDLHEFPSFLLGYFKDGTPPETVAAFLDDRADLLESKYAQHALALLRTGASLARQQGDANGERWFVQRVGLMEGMLRSPQATGLTFAPGERIDDRIRVYYGSKGGMGEVFFGRDEQEDRICAVKFALPGKTFGDHFLEEVTAWLLLSGHPNIVDAYYSGSDEKRQYLLMEYVPGPPGCGPSLRDRLRVGRLDLRQVLEWALQFCDGMRWAATQVPDIVHRDIKPENILLDHKGTLKIADWGLVAAQLPASSPLRVMVGDQVFITSIPEEGLSRQAQCGTPAYMAPEQFARQPVTVQTDVYGFGCVLYEMLTGRPPFLCRGREEFARAHTQLAPEPVDRACPSSPHRLSATIARCLAKDPSRRFPDFAEPQASLRQIYERELGGRWSPPSPVAHPLRVQVERCIGLSKAGRQEAALKVVERILEKHPRDPFAVFTKGNILKELGRHREAIATLRFAAELDPEQPSPWFNLGVLYLVTGDDEHGRECLRKAADLGHEKARQALTTLDSDGTKILIIT